MLGPVAPPDPVDGDAAHANLSSQRARAPVCDPSRLCLEGRLDYLVYLLLA